MRYEVTTPIEDAAAAPWLAFDWPGRQPHDRCGWPNPLYGPLHGCEENCWESIGWRVNYGTLSKQDVHTMSDAMSAYVLMTTDDIITTAEVVERLRAVRRWVAKVMKSGTWAGEILPTITGHTFVPVSRHYNNDECAYRADGTNNTYCGGRRDRHAATP